MTDTVPSVATCPVAHDRPIVEFDFMTNEAAKNPWALLAQARQDNPVFYIPQWDLWMITRYADVRAAFMNPELFSSANATFNPSVPEPYIEQFDGSWPHAYNLVAVDPPAHTWQRKFVQRGFQPSAVADQRQNVEQVVTQLLDRLPSGSEPFDFVAHFAELIMFYTMWRMMGLEPESLEAMQQWKEDALIVQLPEHEGSHSEQSLLGVAERTVRYAKVLTEAIDDRRSNPRSDVISQLANAVDKDGKPPFTINQIIGIVSTSLIGGVDSMAGGFAASLSALLPNREFWRRSADLEFARDAWEEAIRVYGPVRNVVRSTTRRAVVAGVEIPAGQTVLLSLHSANNDETVFEDPRVFNPDRPNVREHLGLGRGAHFCLGAPMSRLVGPVGLSMLAEREPTLRLVPPGPQEWDYAYTNCRIKYLMVQR
jgi:cytochrome P450